MPSRSEQMADYIADRLEFITFLACCSALLALLTGMSGQQALAFTALNLPFGLVLLLGLAMLAPLPAHWRLPGITLLLLGGGTVHPAAERSMAQSAGDLEPVRPAGAGDPVAGSSQNAADGERARLIPLIFPPRCADG